MLHIIGLFVRLIDEDAKAYAAETKQTTALFSARILKVQTIRREKSVCSAVVRERSLAAKRSDLLFRKPRFIAHA
ncbi:hypothetical protein CDO73_26005 [Saccharibacillus sp. O23]|nr:hypothetical protein CDO73_26005 [Saccharibacillus sp. O23]